MDIVSVGQQVRLEGKEGMLDIEGCEETTRSSGKDNM
jgi:hypothetical protein